jgi:ABC-type taurine transport system substrate-binding protein
VLNGDFDATVQGFVPVLTRAAAGLPVKIVDVVDNSGSTYVIVGKKSITNVEGLKGKMVGVNRASNYDYFLTQALQKYGMKETDLKIVNFPDPAKSQSAFLAGQLDAIVPITTNTNAILKQRSDAAIIFKAADFASAPNPSSTPFAIYDLVTTTSGVLQKKGSALAKLSSVFHSKVHDYITSPATQSAAIDDLYAWQQDVVKATVTKDDILASIKTTQFYDQTEAAQIVGGGELVSNLKAISQFLVSSGVLKQAPDVASIVDASLFKAS